MINRTTLLILATTTFGYAVMARRSDMGTAGTYDVWDSTGDRSQITTSPPTCGTEREMP